DVEILSPIAESEKAARAAEGVNELAACRHEKAGRHRFREERVVRGEELRVRLSRRRQGRHLATGGVRDRERIEARIDRHARDATFAIHPPVRIDAVEILSESAGALAGTEDEHAA